MGPTENKALSYWLVFGARWRHLKYHRSSVTRTNQLLERSVPIALSFPLPGSGNALNYCFFPVVWFFSHMESAIKCHRLLYLFSKNSYVSIAVCPLYALASTGLESYQRLQEVTTAMVRSSSLCQLFLLFSSYKCLISESRRCRLAYFGGSEKDRLVVSLFLLAPDRRVELN